ncbi:MAG: DUF5312 domain-containing protein [Treponema sp.]|jgi:hypothetical protein|nr:DUF5312 domain-containing protein [Treponema sp.]
MGEEDAFNRLSLELTLEERTNLLDKLTNQSSMSQEPLYEDKAAAPLADMEKQYTRQPWYYRLWFWLLSLFKSRSPFKLYEDRELAKLGKLINSSAPGCYDHTKGILLPEFYNLLLGLKEGSRFFYSALDAGVNQDKGAFYAFLGSLEMEAIHTRLEQETAPALIAEKNPSVKEEELKQIAVRLMDDIMSVISEDERTRMYADARSLICLKQLSSFLFDRVLLAFSTDSSVGGMTCSASVIRDSLQSLNNILFSLKTIPSMALLESLFIFILREQTGENIDINAEIHRLLSKAENALSAIRNFNQKIPMTLLYRCASRDMAFIPREISGGEDWFTVYQDYWRQCIDMRFAAFLRARRQMDLMTAFRNYLNGVSLRRMSNIQSDGNPDGIPLDDSMALSFLLTFYQAIFMADLNQVLRPILIDGDFIKRENHLEFAEAYNELIKLEDSIKKLDDDISHSGELGKRYEQAKADMTSPAIKRRKGQLVIEEASEISAGIVERAKIALVNMSNVLRGATAKEPVGAYEPLANYNQMVKKIPNFAGQVENAITRLEKAAWLLEDITTLETDQ